MQSYFSKYFDYIEAAYLNSLKKGNYVMELTSLSSTQELEKQNKRLEQLLEKLKKKGWDINIINGLQPIFRKKEIIEKLNKELEQYISGKPVDLLFLLKLFKETIDTKNHLKASWEQGMQNLKLNEDHRIKTQSKGIKDEKYFKEVNTLTKRPGMSQAKAIKQVFLQNAETLSQKTENAFRVAYFRWKKYPQESMMKIIKKHNEMKDTYEGKAIKKLLETMGIASSDNSLDK